MYTRWSCCLKHWHAMSVSIADLATLFLIQFHTNDPEKTTRYSQNTWPPFTQVEFMVPNFSLDQTWLLQLFTKCQRLLSLYSAFCHCTTIQFSLSYTLSTKLNDYSTRIISHLKIVICYSFYWIIPLFKTLFAFSLQFLSDAITSWLIFSFPYQFSDIFS